MFLKEGDRIVIHSRPTGHTTSLRNQQKTREDEKRHNMELLHGFTGYVAEIQNRFEMVGIILDGYPVGTPSQPQGPCWKSSIDAVGSTEIFLDEKGVCAYVRSVVSDEEEHELAEFIAEINS